MKLITGSVAASFICGMLALQLTAADWSVTPQIAAEIQRIRTASNEIAPKANLPGVASSLQASLKAADEALHVGMSFLALEKLAPATNAGSSVEAGLWHLRC